MNEVPKTIQSFFKDKDGKLILLQMPNAPLIIWFVGLVIAKFTEGSVQQIASGASFGALLVWAGLEIFQGVNYFRRTLGLIILILSIYSRVAN